MNYICSVNWPLFGCNGGLDYFVVVILSTVVAGFNESLRTKSIIL